LFFFLFKVTIVTLEMLQKIYLHREKQCRSPPWSYWFTG